MHRLWILVLLTITLLGTVGTAGSRDRTIEGRPQVVRIYLSDRAALDQIAGQLDIWEAHLDELYVVAPVRPAELQWLQDLGYRLEVDGDKTIQLGVQAALDPRFHYFDSHFTNPNGNYMVDFMQGTNTLYPDLTELFDIGDAWLADQQGEHDRDIWVLRITNEDPAYGPLEEKPVFYLFAGIHAREVAIPELAVRYIKYLTTGYNGEGGYDVDADVTWLVNHHTIYVLLSQNPDGHVVNEQDIGAYWRKNLDNDDGCSSPDTWGVDLNRNHSFFWGCCGGSSESPCAETYRGPSRGSEPETQAFEAHFAGVMPDQNGANGDDELPPAAPITTTGIFLSLHSYQDEILWPYGFSAGGAPNDAQLETIGRKLAYYTDYEPTGFLYVVDGSTDDWVYGKFGVAAFTFEVGPVGYGTCSGFFPAFECIDGATGYPEDFWAENKPAFLYAHKIARTPYLTAYGPDAENLAVTPGDVLQGAPVDLTATIADRRYTGDPLRPIAAAEYFLDAPGDDGTGIPMAPADGEWGGLTEAVGGLVDTSPLEPGKHTLLVHGQNDQGDWGPLTGIFITTTVDVEPSQSIFLPLVMR